MNPLSHLSEAMDELINSFMAQPIVGTTTAGITQYIFWMFVAIAIFVTVIFRFKKRQGSSFVPQGIFVNLIEFAVDFVRNDVCKGVLGATWKSHFPFLASIFFFVLFNNLLGLIPGCKPGTGTMGVTTAVATCSFCYFVYVGCKLKGVWGYIKSLAPEGVPFILRILLGIIEAFSTFLRLITLAVRLFCNMFAGHIVMGTFAVLAALFVEPLLEQFTIQALANASTSIFWVAILFAIYLVEMLVAVIQAYVFTLLSAVYIQLVESEH